jgi:hypothetical protein
MVSFTTHYRHLGRALAKSRRALFGAPVYLVLLLIGFRLWGPRGAAATILVPVLVYGFLPTVVTFARVLSVRRASRRGEPIPSESIPQADDEVVREPAARGA